MAFHGSPNPGPSNGPPKPPEPHRHGTWQSGYSISEMKMDPDEYAVAVKYHSKLTPAQSLYPGLHYENFSTFLSQNDIHNPSFDFAWLYNLNQGLDKSGRISHLDDPEVFLKLCDNRKNVVPKHNHLLFLRGFPSPLWLKAIGSKCHVDPEFFQRHLDFLPTMGRPDYFAFPTLPSSASNTIRLWIPSIGSMHKEPRGPQAALEAARVELHRAMTQYSDNINHLQLGDSLVRGFSLFDQQHFSILQYISITVVKRADDTWTAIIWLDNGNRLSKDSSSRKLLSSLSNSNFSINPIIQHQPKIALKSSRLENPPARKSSNPNQRTSPVPEAAPPLHRNHPVQSAQLLHKDYGRLLDPTIASLDPFYLLNELFTFSAFAETQFLNMLHAKLVPELKPETISEKKYSLSNLQYIKSHLDAHIQHLRTTLAVIRSRGSSRWPSGLKEKTERQIDKADAAARTLERDFEYLLMRATTLAERAEAGMSFVMKSATIDVSASGLVRAGQSTRLARLAFVYVPLNLTTSYFGMNFRELGAGKLGLWVWFAVSVPVFCISCWFCFFDFTAWSKRWGRRKQEGRRSEFELV